MSRSPRTTRALVCAVGAAVGLLLTGCVTAPTVTSTSAVATSGTATTSSSSATGDASSTCTPSERQSYSPSTNSDYAVKIKNRGYLLVGVSADTRLLGAVNPANPSQFQGFDIDMARLVATAIFGSATDANLKFKVISTADRIPQLQTAVNTSDNSKGGVDMVARAFTMTCARWKQVAFSAEYLTARQGILVPKASKVATMTDLSGKSVCAAKGSTSVENLKQFPQVKIVEVSSHTDCLVRLQQGRVDAVTGDNTILAGFRDQDPATKVVPQITLGKEPYEPYGLAVPLEHKDFAAYINSVLVKAGTDGAWQKAYAATLAPALGAATQPTPLYGRS